MVFEVEGGPGFERVAGPDTRLRKEPGVVALLGEERARTRTRSTVGPDDHPVPAPADRDVRIGEPSIAERPREGQPRTGTFIVEHEGREIGLPLRQRERTAQQGALARCPVAGQRELVTEQRFEAEHVLPFDLAAPPVRVLGPIEIEGIESHVQRIHPQRPPVDDVAPPGVQEVLRGHGVLGMELVHVEPHRAFSLARRGAGVQPTDAGDRHGAVPCLQPGHGGDREEMGIESDPLRLRHELRCVVLTAVRADVHQPVQ